jgi:hypothetical protein
MPQGRLPARFPFLAFRSSFRPTRTSGNDTRFAYGAGLQVKVAGLAVRAEYERISAGGGNPDLLSLALTWGL